jgi:hypothetical protein
MAKPKLPRHDHPEYKQKKAEYMREYRKENPEKFRLIDVKKKFGLSSEDYSELLEESGGVCAICHKPETKLDYRTGKLLNLSIDHNHTTGEVRGMLCMDCNRALGMFQDSSELLLNAIVYLQKYNS